MREAPKYSGLSTSFAMRRDQNAPERVCSVRVGFGCSLLAFHERPEQSKKSAESESFGAGRGELGRMLRINIKEEVHVNFLVKCNFFVHVLNQVLCSLLEKLGHDIFSASARQSRSGYT